MKYYIANAKNKEDLYAPTRKNVWVILLNEKKLKKNIYIVNAFI